MVLDKDHMNTNQKLSNASSIALTQCLDLKSTESLLVVSNIETNDIAKSLFQAGLDITSDCRWLVYPAGQMNGEEPPIWVANALKDADVVIAPTQKSISHTKARREACKKYHTRIATLPGITVDSFIRGLSADYAEIKRLSEYVRHVLANHQQAIVTSPSGTDLTIDLGNEPIQSIGDITQPGTFSNLPDGESELAPTNANGVLVVDRCGHYITEPTKIVISNGFMTDIEQSPSGKRFEQLINDAMEMDGNTNAQFIAEFAIGTNPTARVTGNILEDEKVLGTCHIAFGDNTSYPGGSNESVLHIDTIVISPTIIMDGETIVNNGMLNI
jgi:leucyl aminopeptidase (aminopeptidase T)